MQYLDFEQPIADLEDKIEQLQDLSVGDGVLKPEIDRLKKKARQLRINIYKSYTMAACTACSPSLSALHTGLYRAHYRRFYRNSW